MSVIAQVERLIEYADPMGATHKRLQRISQLARDGVIISVDNMKFLQRLQDTIDNIECDHFSVTKGTCRIFKRQCPHTKAFTRCDVYRRARG